MSFSRLQVSRGRRFSIKSRLFIYQITSPGVGDCRLKWDIIKARGKSMWQLNVSEADMGLKRIAGGPEWIPAPAAPSDGWRHLWRTRSDCCEGFHVTPWQNPVVCGSRSLLNIVNLQSTITCAQRWHARCCAVLLWTAADSWGGEGGGSCWNISSCLWGWFTAGFFSYFSRTDVASKAV